MALMLTPQRIIVVRHGERLDNVDYRWTDTADRPYDPPLTEKGEEQARETGKRFVGKVIVYCCLSHVYSHAFMCIQEIHSIITSPFLRCLQTAQLISEVLRLPGLHTCNGIVDILNGSCGIREQPVVPASNIAELGINVASTDGSKLPKHPERTFDAIKRYVVSSSLRLVCGTFLTIFPDLGLNSAD